MTSDVQTTALEVSIKVKKGHFGSFRCKFSYFWLWYVVCFREYYIAKCFPYCVKANNCMHVAWMARPDFAELDVFWTLEQHFNPKM